MTQRKPTGIVPIPRGLVERNDLAAEASCQLCSADSTMHVLTWSAALDENDPKRTVFGWLCHDCRKKEEARRAID